MPKKESNPAPVFNVEDVPLVKAKNTSSPVSDALEIAIMALKPGQSFAVEKKGQLQTARKVAKDLGIAITTSESQLRVALRNPKE